MAKQKMVPFHVAVKNFFTRYVEFSGRSTRSEYWFAVLFLWLAGMLIDFVGVNILGLIWSLAIFIPELALAVRRFHDAGYSAKRFFALWLTGLALFVVMIVSVGAFEAGTVGSWGVGLGIASLLLGVVVLLVYTIYIMCKPSVGVSKAKRVKNK